MNRQSLEELIEAAGKIQDYCVDYWMAHKDENEPCEGCLFYVSPFFDDLPRNECLLGEYDGPTNWQLALAEENLGER